MADLTITAANVKEGAKARKKSGVAGEAITAGQAIFIDASDSKKIKKATAIASAPGTAAAVAGIALNSAANGQTVIYQTGGRIVIGATVAVAETYILSDAGAIAPIGDLASSDYLTYLGYGVSTTEIELTINATALEKA